MARNGTKTDRSKKLFVPNRNRNPEWVPKVANDQGEREAERGKEREGEAKSDKERMRMIEIY